MELELRRKKYAKKLNILAISFAFSYIAFITTLLLIKRYGIIESAIKYIIFITIALIFIYENMRFKFQKEVKNRLLKIILDKILTSVNNNNNNNIKINFNNNTTNKTISTNEILVTQLYTKYDIIQTNNHFIGYINGICIKFCDLNIYNYANNIKKWQKIVLFKGMFFTAKFNKKIKGIISIIDKYSNANTNGKRAYMDNLEFENIFNVYTFDQIAARYILTPKMMLNIIKIKKMFNCELNVIFMGNSIYIYINSGFNIFDMDINNSLFGKNSQIKSYQEKIGSLINLVKNLDLENDIFIK